MEVKIKFLFLFSEENTELKRKAESILDWCHSLYGIKDRI